jgi:hypothetical protein
MERHATILLASVLLACGSGAAEPTPEEPAPPAPPVVPLTLPELELVGRCVALDPSETLVGVGTEGDAWIGSTDGRFRVVPAEGDERIVDLAMSPSLVRPWSGHAAAFAVGTRLFVRDGEGPLTEIGWPRELGAIVDLCGDPRRDGAFVVAEGAGDEPAGLYRRAGGEWWRWTPPSGSFGAGMALADVAGACTADDDRAWLRSTSGLFSLREDAIRTYGRVDAVSIDRGVGVASLSAGKLLFLRGDDWKETRFAAGSVDAMAGSAGHLWVRVGERLHHYADGEFSLAALELPGSIEAFVPDAAGGLWITSGDQLCRRAPPDAWRVSGVRPFERHVDPELTIAVADASSITIELDARVVHEGEGPATFLLGAPGWHRVDVRVGSSARRFDVLRVDTHAPTWETDVRPIAEAHCGGSACHGATRDDVTRPALADYESWVELADAIRHRVGVVADMPPVANRDGWTASEVTTVVAWIAAGMEERDASE